MSLWQPTKFDIEWSANLISYIKDGGVWGVPMNDTVYRLDKTNRILKLIRGPKDGIFERITATFAQLGWKVIEAREKVTQEILDEAFGFGKVVLDKVNTMPV